MLLLSTVSARVPKITLQERQFQRHVEVVVEVPVPMIQEEIVQVPKIVQRERVALHPGEQVLEVPLRITQEEVVRVAEAHRSPARRDDRKGAGAHRSGGAVARAGRPPAASPQARSRGERRKRLSAHDAGGGRARAEGHHAPARPPRASRGDRRRCCRAAYRKPISQVPAVQTQECVVQSHIEVVVEVPRPQVDEKVLEVPPVQIGESIIQCRS